MISTRYPLFLALLISAACVGTPNTYQFESSRQLGQSFDVTWQRAIEFFASRSIPIKTLEKDSGVVYAEAQSFGDLQQYADCGFPDSVKLTGMGQFNVLARSEGDGSYAQVTTTYVAIIGSSRYPCNSRGTLEGVILDSLSQ